MIINLESNNSITSAEGVKYGESNVAQELTELAAKGVSLTDSITALGTRASALETKDTSLTSSINSLTTRASTLENELTANGKRIYLDYKDGKYGYNTSATRGADTFSPFKSGGDDSELTVLTTMNSATGKTLTNITGTGYIMLKHLGYLEETGSTGSIWVSIDGNTPMFPLNFSYYNTRYNNYYKLYFQKSIHFSNGDAADGFLCQTLLADKEIPDRYNIIHSVTTDQSYITFEGRGKIILTPNTSNIVVYYSVDGGTENTLNLTSNQHTEFMFTKSFKFKKGNTNVNIYYLVYLDL